MKRAPTTTPMATAWMPRNGDRKRVQTTRRDAPGLSLARAGEVAGEDGDERRGERARHEEPEDRVGDLERGPEGVELGGLAEPRADDRKAQPSEDPAGDEGGDHDRRGARDGHRHRVSIESSGIVRSRWPRRNASARL